jgi:dTDP-4-dehydrorhamnose 3,5-epimerase
VVVDLRPDSPTYLRHAAAELSAENSLAMYVPERCAHGFVTLTDGAEVLYQMSEFHEPAAARGVRWNDPAFGIVWPVANPILHPRDASYPDFSPESTR